jgi:hypothetical protein
VYDSNLIHALQRMPPYLVTVLSSSRSLLAVEDGFRYPAQVRRDGRLRGHDDPTPPGVLDDAVDEAIEVTLRHDGEVRFVAADHLAEWGGIAAVMRSPGLWPSP